MLVMRAFQKNARIQSDSTPEIQRAWEMVALALSGETKFQGRKLRPGPLLSALVLWFTRLAPEERARIGRDAVRALEAHMAGEDMAGPSLAPGAIPENWTTTGKFTPEPEPEKKRKRN